MSAVRFTWQILQCRRHEGKILNLGCNIDPGNIKGIFGDRVVNADLHDYDVTLDAKLPVDVVMDARDVWPFAYGEFGLVILGDILEHVDEVSAKWMLAEARRVGDSLCITVPNDDRLGPGWHSDGTRDENPVTAEGLYHVQQVTREKLEGWLAEAKWEIEEFKVVPYHFAIEGYFVIAH